MTVSSMRVSGSGWSNTVPGMARAAHSRQSVWLAGESVSSARPRTGLNAARETGSVASSLFMTSFDFH